MLKGEIRKILIFKWSAMGDIILAVPSFRAIRAHFPQAKIHLLIKKEYQELLNSLSYIDNFIDFKKSNWRDLIPELKKEKFDLSIDFQNTWRSHLLSFLVGVKRRVGYGRKGGRLLLNVAAAQPKKIENPVEHQARLLSKIGINLDNFELECKIPSIVSLPFPKPYISILPGSGEGWQSKCWSELCFARMADSIINKLKYSAVFLGEKREKNKIERIKKAMREKGQDMSGQTKLIQLAGVIKGSSLFITHDTGPMHLAQALGVPTLALFGPTDPMRHTIPSSNLYIIKKNLSCQPCYRRRCSAHQCMKLIRVEEVLDKIKQIMKTNNPTRYNLSS
ncbi:MAG: glycosyltransferase family 9 protein [Candidatus Ratteibacteria bacterium]|nr:glycosyltransferase family 9 protein [Candidatus Ratteibacteria bacterium]